MKLSLTLAISATSASKTCANIGTDEVRCDPTLCDAETGGLGCNAGGQGMQCRFCGNNDPFPPCGPELSHCCGECCDDWCTTTSSTTSATSATASGTTSAGTTTIKTTKSTTPRPTKPPLPEECYDNPIFDPNYEAQPGELVFEENWDDFNQNIWEHELTMGGGGNWEFQTYYNNRTNSYVRDNTLFIKPTYAADRESEDFLRSGRQDLWGAQPSDQCTGNAWWGCERVGNPTNIINPIDSARIRTVKSFNIKNARIEIDAQLPRGDWLWPAIWMLPNADPCLKHLSYGKWPASGEIDIMESRGNNVIVDPVRGTEAGNNCFGSTLHWGPYFPANGFEKTHESVCLPNGRSFADEWHTYTLDWTTEYISFELDGDEFMRVPKPANGFWSLGEFEKDYPGSTNPWTSGSDMAPFDSEFYLLINLAVGGANDYWSDDFWYENRKPWRTTSSQAMLDFWNDRAKWEATWNGEEAALKIGKIRMWKRGDGSEELDQTFKPRARRQLKKNTTKLVNLTKPNEKIVPAEIRQPGDLIFHEPFDTLDMNVWEHEMTMNGGGNWEFQVYYNNRTNSYVKDSTLFLQPSLTADILGEEALSRERLDLWGAQPSDECTGNAWWGCERVGGGDNYLPPAYSARLRTAKSFSCRYCRVEVEAKLPRGDWIWPAIWMLPKHLDYGKWPASGEIDIMESRGNVNLKHHGQDIGVECYGATLHWGPFWPFNGYEKTTEHYCLEQGRTFNDDFHIFTVDWQPDHFSFELDGVEILRVDPGQGGFWELGDFGDVDNPWIGSDGLGVLPFM